MARAVEGAGGSVVDTVAAANAIVWTAGASEAVRSLLHAGVEWVQLPSAGIDEWLARALLDDDRIWTTARGVYAGRVAEHAVALLLAASRRLGVAARRTTWGDLRSEPLEGASVGVFGAGAIGEELFRRLEPFGVRRLALTRSGRPVSGADVAYGADALDELLRASDYLVLAAPLTSETDGVIDARALELFGQEAWLVNVGRGRLVQTDALCAALAAGRIAGACLDVTDPEPLPDGHPLWSFENVLITPHVANPWHRHEELLAARVAENVGRFNANHELLGAVDLNHGY